MRRPSRQAVVAAAALLTACADQASVLPVTQVDRSDAAAIDRLVELGFAREDIVDAGDRLVAEGDMVFRKADLRAGGPALNRMSVPGPRGQWKVTTPIMQSLMRNGITVNLSGISGNSAWLAAARLAMSDWELLSGTNTVKFIESTASGSMPISFGTPTNPGAIAEAGLPVSGYPGGGIVIDQSLGSSLSAGQKRWVMVHELGHVIGLRHSDMFAYGETAGTPGADSIPNTPSNDGSSVMRGHPSSTPSFSAFSNYDKVAAEYMFPATIPTITSVGYDGSGHPTLSWNAVTYATGYKIRFDSRFVEWIEDPSRYEGGYWAESATNGDITTTTSTSFTDLYNSYTGDDWCQYDYQVWTIYPSGKQVGPALTSVLPVCGPYPG